MTRHDPAPPPDDLIPPHTLPQWEHLDRHRGSLQRRARSVRGALLAGGAVGTLAFSALAGYESTTPTAADPSSATATLAPVGQTTEGDFFSGQAGALIGAGTATITPAVTTTPDPDAPDPSPTAVPRDGAVLSEPAGEGSSGPPPPLDAVPSAPANPPPPGNGPPPPGNGAPPPPPPPPPDASTHPTR